MTASGFARERLWAHGGKWLCMSATVISAQEMAASMGVQEDKWASVEVPMTFPKENRPIYLAPVADMSKKGKDAGSWARMTDAVRLIIEKHHGEGVLVHTHTYELARHLASAFGPSPRIHTYLDARDRDHVLKRFRSNGGVLLAPSMQRGVDLPDDLCRVIVIAKVPYPYLGDRQVSARMRMPGGRVWYQVQTVRDVVQMTGRAVRSKDDWAVSYVLDSTFTRQLWRDYKHLFPRWWREAVRTDFDVRSLQQGR